VTPILGLLVLVIVAAATLAGGMVPLRFEQHSRVFLSFSAGTLVGLALIGLIPEALRETGGEPHLRMLVVLAAFLVTLLLDKLHALHPHSHGMDADCPPEEHEHPPLAIHGAIGLVVHSAVDGLALAAASRLSMAAVLAVALALAAHKFADGLTTVALVLGHHHRRVVAVRLLVANAAALAIGFAAGMALTLEESSLGNLLLVMAGFFLYLGASDLIPEITTPRCRKRDVFATACGMAVIAVIALLAR